MDFIHAFPCFIMITRLCIGRTYHDCYLYFSTWINLYFDWNKENWILVMTKDEQFLWLVMLDLVIGAPRVIDRIDISGKKKGHEAFWISHKTCLHFFVANSSTANVDEITSSHAICLLWNRHQQRLFVGFVRHYISDNCPLSWSCCEGRSVICLWRYHP